MMFPELARDDVFRLETRRLWLRWPRRADADILARVCPTTDLARRPGVPQALATTSAAADYVAAMRDANETGRQLALVLTPKGDPAGLVGGVALTASLPGTLELGFWGAAGSHAEGMVAEAVEGLLDFAFTFTGAREIGATIRSGNPQARQMLERLGFGLAGSGLEASASEGGMVPVERWRLERRTFVGREDGRGASAGLMLAAGVRRACYG